MLLAQASARVFEVHFALKFSMCMCTENRHFVQCDGHLVDVANVLVTLTANAAAKVFQNI